MINLFDRFPLNQYSVMRGSGAGVLFSIFFMLISIVVAPYVWFSMWKYDRLPEEKKGFGKFNEIKGKNYEN